MFSVYSCAAVRYKLKQAPDTKLESRPIPDDRYTMRKEDDGTWSVVDFFADIPVTLKGIPMVKLHM